MILAAVQGTRALAPLQVTSGRLAFVFPRKREDRDAKRIVDSRLRA